MGVWVNGERPHPVTRLLDDRDETRKQLAEADATIERIRDEWRKEHVRLLRWGQHDKRCAFMKSAEPERTPCDCGFDAEWRKYGEMASTLTGG